MQVKLPMFECLRCGHKWYPKKPEVPRCCGKCKSPYWNKPRRQVEDDRGVAKARGRRVGGRGRAE